MFAAKQRRHFSPYLLLPLVIAIVPLLVAKLVAWQRADIIAELADRVAHRDSQDAALAVRQLAAMPGAPMAILVAAATSTEVDIADEARLGIGRILRRCQRNIESKSGLAVVARQLSELAEALEAKQDLFSAADHPWLAGTSQKVLRLSNRIPGPLTPRVALHCDSVLASIAAKQAASTEIADTDPEFEQSPPEESIIERVSQPRQATLPREMAKAAVGAVHATAQSADRIQSDTRPYTPVENSAENWLRSPWRASWSQPAFRIVPAEPKTEPVRESTSAQPSADIRPENQSSAAESMNSAPSLDLLHRWLQSSSRDDYALEQELGRRGFGLLSESLVRPLFSGNPKDRLALLDRVLTESGVDSRPWLVLLSEDSAADVRLLAVTMMATSNDPLLVEKAWQATLRDRDPRIAGLAGRLRDRRAGTQRR